jgi:predicted metal-dependent enzyme (double-stranded beta helix superfamily)
MTAADDANVLLLACRYAAQSYEWPVAPRFRPRKRWSVRLAELADCEVWLTTWLPGQGTPVHAHETAGAVYVLRGELEEIVEPAGHGCSTVVRTLRAGCGLVVTAGRHRIVNRGLLPGASIHVHVRR